MDHVSCKREKERERDGEIDREIGPMMSPIKCSIVIIQLLHFDWRKSVGGPPLNHQFKGFLVHTCLVYYVYLLCICICIYIVPVSVSAFVAVAQVAVSAFASLSGSDREYCVYL